MNKITKINPTTMKQPTRAYSNGIYVPKNADLLFITGQLSQDSEGNVVAPNDMEGQTRFVFGQIGRILEAAGMTFDNIVKLTIFVVDMKNASCVSKIRDEFCKNSKPASSMLGVTGFIKDECVIEIEAIAAKQ
jgi:Putative translation initiation inhibitor, yjgF family